MRFRVVFAVAALAFALAPVAHAATLPDLPGMGPAQKAVGQTPATASASSTTRSKRVLPTANASEASSPSSALTSDAAKTIRNLPGGAAIPAIGKIQAGLTSSHNAIPGPDGLIVFAALGSFAALGALYMLRRLGRI